GCRGRGYRGGREYGHQHRHPSHNELHGVLRGHPAAARELSCDGRNREAKKSVRDGLELRLSGTLDIDLSLRYWIRHRRTSAMSWRRAALSNASSRRRRASVFDVTV